jgi:glycosyltransferase involved in cell wall biosynthesis
LDVTAIAASSGEPNGSIPPSDLDVEVIPIEPTINGRGLIHRYRNPHSELGSGPFAARVKALAKDADLVHLDEVQSAAAGHGLGVPSVVCIHCLSRLDRPPGAPWTKEARDFVKLARAEDRVVRQAQWIIANSVEVADELRRSGAQEVDLAPLTLDPADYQPSASADPPIAGLIGKAVWQPTANAVRFLINDVWPLVLRRVPAAKLRLAGWGMTKESFPELPDLKGVEWVGPVSSGREFLRSVGMLLYPLNRGSGTKVKTLEAMALGLPIVTTARGAEGLRSGSGILVEEGAEALAEATAGLLRDCDARRRLGEQAQDQFRRAHAPTVATRPILETYGKMLHG